MLALAGQAGEVRQAVDRHVDLAGAAAELEAADLLLEVGGERAGLEEVQERDLGVGRGEHDGRLDLLAALQQDAGGAAVAGDDLPDRGLGADLGAQGLRGAGDRVGDAAGAALGDAPGAEGAVDLAHVVVQEHVGRAG